MDTQEQFWEQCYMDMPLIKLSFFDLKILVGIVTLPE